jgi:hypothetical protein
LLDGAGQTVVVELEDPSLQAANDTLYLFWWQYAAPVPLACKGDPENEGCCSGDYRCASCRFESDDWGGSTTTCCYGSCCTDWDDPALKDSCSPTGGGYEKY